MSENHPQIMIVSSIILSVSYAEKVEVTSLVEMKHHFGQCFCVIDGRMSVANLCDFYEFQCIGKRVSSRIYSL